jgi:hypothetical protein
VSCADFPHAGRNRLTIDIVACSDRTPPEANMWVQIVLVAIVAVVFLVRLVFALYDQPSKSRN